VTGAGEQKISTGVQKAVHFEAISVTGWSREGGRGMVRADTKREPAWGSGRKTDVLIVREGPQKKKLHGGTPDGLRGIPKSRFLKKEPQKKGVRNSSYSPPRGGNVQKLKR